MSEDIKNAVAEFKELQKNFKKDMTDKLSKGFNAFFAAHPEFRSIEWVQYTPYFNDGEECTFRVNDFYYSAQPQFYEDGGEWLEEHYSIYDLEGTEPFNRHNRTELYKAWIEFSRALISVPDDIYKAVFGDHSRITVTKDGITVEQYDHD